MKKFLKTNFAPAERSETAELLRQKTILIGQMMNQVIFDSLPEIVMILNSDRQLVYCNKSLLDFLNVKFEDVFGKRPGEVINCIHAYDETGGCGTTIFCRECGAVRSIMTAIGGKENFSECMTTIKSGGKEQVFDFRVWSFPININSEKFIIFTIRDIGDEKRRSILERTFFHDILNDASILLGSIDNVVDEITPMDKDALRSIRKIAKKIVSNIQTQRDLTAAEEGLLKVSIKEFDAYDFLNEIVEAYQRSELCKNRKIVLECFKNNRSINTDPIILGRIIGNLIKNALEATGEGCVVEVGFREKAGRKLFWVKNPEVMPDNVQHQIFQRSFTTKGRGRGIGTYSVKFFSENFLNGKASFVSKIDAGTTFFIELP